MLIALCKPRYSDKQFNVIPEKQNLLFWKNRIVHFFSLIVGSINCRVTILLPATEYFYQSNWIPRFKKFILKDRGIYQLN